MSISALDYYRLKAEFLPSEFQLLAVYIRSNDDLAKYVDTPTEWEFVGRTLHPNRMQVADVERQGYCLRKVSADIDAGSLYRTKTA
jgi:hypothetical protein